MFPHVSTPDLQSAHGPAMPGTQCCKLRQLRWLDRIKPYWSDISVPTCSNAARQAETKFEAKSGTGRGAGIGRPLAPHDYRREPCWSWTRDVKSTKNGILIKPECMSCTIGSPLGTEKGRPLPHSNQHIQKIQYNTFNTAHIKTNQSFPIRQEPQGRPAGVQESTCVQEPGAFNCCGDMSDMSRPACIIGGILKCIQLKTTQEHHGTSRTTTGAKPNKIQTSAWLSSNIFQYSYHISPLSHIRHHWRHSARHLIARERRFRDGFRVVSQFWKVIMQD